MSVFSYNLGNEGTQLSITSLTNQIGTGRPYLW
jgi:hypothetical protein